MASTNLIGDINSVITNGPSTTTQANAIQAAGRIQDYVGNCKLTLLHFQEVQVLLGKVIGVTQSADSANLALLTGVSHLLTGGGSPSTAALADLKTVYTNGPGTATQAAAIAPAGPIMDYLGNVSLCRRKLEEAQQLLTLLKADTDAGSDATNLGLINGMLAVLV